MCKVLFYLLVLGFFLVLSFYQGYRGFMFQWLRSDALFKDWTKSQKFFLLALPDCLTFFITCASGFVSLFLCWKLSVRISDPAKIELGTAALLGFLAVYGILGVTGKLPSLIDRGKLSPPTIGST
jgi:hypothetical protein